MLRALTEQHDEGGSRLVTLSLARTAAWLLDELPARREPDADADAETAAKAAADPSYDPEKWLTETDGPLGGCGTRCRRSPSRAPRRLVAPARPAGGGRGRLAHGLMSTFSAMRSSIAL